jgi:hypothetical protein
MRSSVWFGPLPSSGFLNLSLANLKRSQLLLKHGNLLRLLQLA